MDSTDLPFRPFSFQPKNSPNLLPARDMENSITPNAGQSPPLFADNYESRDTPNIPSRSPQRSQVWNEATRTRETVLHKTASEYLGNSSIQPTPTPSPRSLTFQPLPSPRLQAFRQNDRSPTPPMTKSSQKILQLTGYDPRFERALPIEHQQLSSTRPQPPHSPIRSISSNSTSSFYSQAEASFKCEQAGPPKNSSTSIAQSSNSEGEYLPSSIYNISEHSSKSSNISKPNRKTKTKLNNEQAIQAPPPSPQLEVMPQVQLSLDDEADEPLPPPRFPASSQKSRDSNEITMFHEILAQEQVRYDKKLEKDTGDTYKFIIPITSSPIPSPPTIKSMPQNNTAKQRTKSKPKHITVEKEKKPSIFRSAKDSLEWGIHDFGSPSLSSPNWSKHPTTPVSPMFSMESDHLPLSSPLGSNPISSHTPTAKSRRMKFGSSAKHPLKSPFPFNARGTGGPTTSDDELADSIPSASRSHTFKRRVSSTIKHLSPTSPSNSCNKKSRSSRSSGGPPSSEKFVIMNGARRADGPATPFPPRHGFMEGVMRGKEVLGKVGKSVAGVGTSKEEKRRESLKKKIVVMGITDQSPDGRVAEWL